MIGSRRMRCAIERRGQLLKQKSIIVTEAQVMKASRYVHVDSMDIGCSDHYLVWMELDSTTRTTRKAKRVIRKWHLESIEDKEVKLKYQNALRAEVSGSSESIQGKIARGMKGHS